MQSDTDLIMAIRDYMQSTPYATAYDIVRYFNDKGIPEKTILYILKEIVGINELS